MQDSLRVVQITDTHLYADIKKTLLGINTQNSFSAVLQAVAAQPWQAELVLLTGDLAQDESATAYQRLAQQVTTLEKPTYWIPGNHDNLANMTAKLIGPTLQAAKVIIKKQWQIILLNSQIPGKVPGLLAAAELAFLEECLQKHSQHFALICFHHPPVPTGCGWLDPLGLKNPEELFAILDKYSQVRGIINGHIHQEFEGRYKQIPIYTTPSTCIQFKPKTKNFELDIIPPGFRYLELQADGKLITQVIRADNFKEYTQADPKAKGY